MNENLISKKEPINVHKYKQFENMDLPAFLNAQPTQIKKLKPAELKLSKVPDFSKDPRRTKKALKALDLCYEIQLSYKSEKQIKAKELRAVLGNKSNPDSFSTYLYTLVTQIGSYSIENKTSYCYVTNNERVKKLEQILDVNCGFMIFAEKQGKSFKIAPPRSEYKLAQDNRHYNWWSNIRRNLREKLFLQTHGILFDYDIQAAKATLTLQAWKEIMQLHFPTQLKFYELSTWHELVYNRTAFRQNLQNQIGCTKQQAKDICQNVINSATASTHSDNGLCKILGKEKTALLMENALYKGLAADFANMWKYLSRLRKGNETAGEYCSKFYNTLERQVMDVVECELNLMNVNAWFIHDGFMTTEKVDMNKLEQKIKQKTGYEIKLEEEIKRKEEEE